MSDKRPYKQLLSRLVLTAGVVLGGVSATTSLARADGAGQPEFLPKVNQHAAELNQDVLRMALAVWQLRSESDPAPPAVRCGTGAMIAVSAMAQDPAESSLTARILARPASSEVYDSPGGFFKLHYDLAGAHAVPFADLDNNGTADFIERLALIADSSWRTIITHLGYLAPPLDDGRGGDNRYDIYFQNINAFGFTQSESAGPAAWNDFSSYIVCNNTFAGFPPNDDPEGDIIGTAKATLAHEIFHAVQFAYDKSDEFWFMESSAGWMEEIVFDETNDNYNVLPDFFARPEVALTSNSLQTQRLYGTFVWPLFLAERFDTTLIRQVWEGARFKKATEALADTLPLRFGVTRDDAYSEFVTWLNLAGRHDDGAHFSEGAAYPDMRTSATWSQYPVSTAFGAKSPAGYASAAIRFLPGLASGDLKLTLDGFNGRNWAGFLIATRNLIEHSIRWFTLDSDERGSLIVKDFETYDEVTMVSLNLSIYSSAVSYKYSAELVGSQGVSTIIAGDTIAYTMAPNPVGIRLVNLAQTEDSFTISISASGAWTLSPPSLGTIKLQPGADSLIIGNVAPPPGTPPRAISIVRMRAVSATDPSVIDSVALIQVVSVLRGDPNWDGASNIADAVYLISRLFQGGAPPAPAELAGDPDCSGKVNIGDVAFIVARLFSGGPAPPCQPIDPLGG